MDAEQIVKLTPESVANLLGARQIESIAKDGPAHRHEERWPFAGTVEVWLPDECYGERHLLATMHNLSNHGLAMRTRRAIPSDTRVSIAIHQPTLSCYGHALIRHCTRAAVGYLVGVEFCFEEEPRK